MDLPQVFDDLVRVEIALWSAAEDRLRHDHDLPLAQFEFIRVIDRRGSCRVGDLAADLAITVGGTSKVVDRLAARGLVTRTPNPDDRRSSILTLTEAGSRALRVGTTSLQAVLEERLAAVLSADALDALTTALATLRTTRPGTAPATAPATERTDP